MWSYALTNISILSSNHLTSSFLSLKPPWKNTQQTKPMLSKTTIILHKQTKAKEYYLELDVQYVDRFLSLFHWFIGEYIIL